MYLALRVSGEIIEDTEQIPVQIRRRELVQLPGTLGFWSNKNGLATMNDGGSVCSELALLNGLYLRNAAGTRMNFGCDYNAFKNWLLSATATNMAYMLSAQLEAMELNVEAGFVNGSALVYAPRNKQREWTWVCDD